MGRPKGSQSKPRLDSSNILEPVLDVNQNVSVKPEPPPIKTKKSSAGTRRRSRDVQFWKDLVGPPIEFFPQTKLPQNKVVLQRYLSLRKELPACEKVSSLVNIIYTELVTEVWKPARIFTDSERKCKKAITAVIKTFTKLPHRKVKGGNMEKRVKDMEDFLYKLCDLSPPDLKDRLNSTSRLNGEWEQDWQFYLNMCDRSQPGSVLGTRDKKLATKEGAKQDRKKAGTDRALKSSSNKRKIEEKVDGKEFDDGATNDDDDSADKDIVFHERKKRPKLVLEIDPKKIVEQTTGTTDRLGMSNRQTAMMLATVVKAGGGSLSGVPVSKSAVQRGRKKSRAKKGKSIKKSFVHSDCGFVLHYDTKLVNPKGRDTEDRAAVLYSGGIHKQPYLLGIPKFKSSAGKDVEVGVLAQNRRI